jgi:hypothetical protein
MDFIERRRHPRHRCEVVVEVQTGSGDGPTQGTLADICLGGCYVATMAPFPVDTAVMLTFRHDAGVIVIAGRTVTCLPGSGMGVEFTGSNEAEIALSVRQLTETLEMGIQEAAPSQTKSAAVS